MAEIAHSHPVGNPLTLLEDPSFERRSIAADLIADTVDGGCPREGGVRVPMIWSWPAKLPSGNKHSHVMSSLDLLPTFMAAAEDVAEATDRMASDPDRASVLCELLSEWENRNNHRVGRL